MKIKTLIASASAVLFAGVAHANQSVPGGGTVPEIDALSGLAAIAVVGAAVALIRERSK